MCRKLNKTRAKTRYEHLVGVEKLISLYISLLLWQGVCVTIIYYYCVCLKKIQFGNTKMLSGNIYFRKIELPQHIVSVSLISF